MELDSLRDDIKRIYIRYLSAAIGSALISSIYSIVDMAMVGQSQGPDGTAALAVIAPLWNIIYASGLLMGIGGSVLFSVRRGRGNGGENEFFTASVIGSVILSLLEWMVLLFFSKPCLSFFGGNERLIELAEIYLYPIKFVFPLFLMNQMLAAFLRNDNDPELAAFAVLFGGVLNAVCDYLFVFPLGLGIFGAGLATGLGALVTFLIMCIHFALKRNTLRLKMPCNLLYDIAQVFRAGASTFVVDVSMGVMTVLFNRQIMKYLGPDALAVYGPIINISTIVTCSAYSIGESSQPIISANYGASCFDRINEALRLGIKTSFIFGSFFMLISELFPIGTLKIFFTPDEEMIKMSARAIRLYSLSYMLLPFNVYSSYYFQAIEKHSIAFAVSVMRGIVLSSMMIMLLPLIDAESVWLSMTFTELITSGFVIFEIRKSINNHQ